MTALEPDDKLREFASDKQWNTYLLYCEKGGSIRATSIALAQARGTVRDSLKLLGQRAMRAGYMPTTLPPSSEPALVLKGQSILYDAAGNETGRWDKTKLEGRDPEEGPQLPDPKKIVKMSTLYDQTGLVSQRWITEKPEDVAREALWLQFAETLALGIPAAKPVDTPLGLSSADLLAVYPVGDHHTGMLAWAKECGVAWDLKIAEEMLRKATRKLVSTCPPCEQALLAFLGDLFHTDSYASVTPAHKHLLDSDIRYPKMIEVGVMMIEHAIAAALEKHQHVRVIFEKGNHDESTIAAMTVFFKRLYRDEPRVFVDDSPSFFHVHEFGKVLLATNHGDKVKMEKQLGVLAHDHPEAWGRTTYRMVMTGHIHTEHRKEFPGGWVESFGVLPPADAYAHRGGWRSVQQMHALVFHREFGLVERHVVNPRMLGVQ